MFRTIYNENNNFVKDNINFIDIFVKILYNRFISNIINDYKIVNSIEWFEKKFYMLVKK